MDERKFRIETDTMGPVEVPEEALWGAQTQRALGTGIAVGRMPWGVVSALVLIKRCAAEVNAELGLIPAQVAQVIVRAAEEILDQKAGQHFPLSPFQTGSGTSTNMNVNEVLANRANELLGAPRGKKAPVHPNDHVNRCQSSNDAFPSAIHLAAATSIRAHLLPAARSLAEKLRAKAAQFAEILKLGRTHLMDAVPVTLGQEFGAYATQVENGLRRVEAEARGLLELPLGGTAVGTGLNAHPEFADRVIARLSLATEMGFERARNSFEAQAAKDACVAVSGALRGLAVGLAKIANDLRWMASGPHGGLAEVRLPALQPGSSIMPGKVNPVVPEAVLQACAQTIADDLAVAQAGLGGVFELNLMMPLLARNLLEEIELTAGACALLAERCVAGVEADPERCRALLEGSSALVTPLAEVVGYEAAARVAARAREDGSTLLEAALALGVGEPEDVKRRLDTRAMAGLQEGTQE